MVLNQEAFCALLDDIKKRIKEGDSFEGNIHYTCLKEGLGRGEFEVTGGYRIGNSQGQGGFRTLS